MRKKRKRKFRKNVSVTIRNDKKPDTETVLENLGFEELKKDLLQISSLRVKGFYIGRVIDIWSSCAFVKIISGENFDVFKEPYDVIDLDLRSYNFSILEASQIINLAKFEGIHQGILPSRNMSETSLRLLKASYFNQEPLIFRLQSFSSTHIEFSFLSTLEIDEICSRHHYAFGREEKKVKKQNNACSQKKEDKTNDQKEKPSVIYRGRLEEERIRRTKVAEAEKKGAPTWHIR